MLALPVIVGREGALSASELGASQGAGSAVPARGALELLVFLCVEDARAPAQSGASANRERVPSGATTKSGAVPALGSQSDRVAAFEGEGCSCARTPSDGQVEDVVLRGTQPAAR